MATATLGYQGNSLKTNTPTYPRNPQTALTSNSLFTMIKLPSYLNHPTVGFAYTQVKLCPWQVVPQKAVQACALHAGAKEGRRAWVQYTALQNNISIAGNNPPKYPDIALKNEKFLITTFLRASCCHMLDFHPTALRSCPYKVRNFSLWKSPLKIIFKKGSW